MVIQLELLMSILQQHMDPHWLPHSQLVRHCPAKLLVHHYSAMALLLLCPPRLPIPHWPARIPVLHCRVTLTMFHCPARLLGIHCPTRLLMPVTFPMFHCPTRLLGLHCPANLIVHHFPARPPMHPCLARLFLVTLHFIRVRCLQSKGNFCSHLSGHRLLEKMAVWK